MRSPRTSLLFIASVLACEHGTEQTEDWCSAAADRIVTCGLAVPTDVASDCDVERAEALATTTCDELEASATLGKADGWWDAFMCGLGFVRACPLPDPQRVSDSGWWDHYVLPGSTLHPEGGAFDPTDEVFYVGSLEDARILAVDARSAAVSTLSPPLGDRWRSLGMAVDADARRLWVCVVHDVDAQHGEVWRIDLSTRAVDRYDLRSAAEGGSCNDVAVAKNGDVYATDREQGHVYQLDAALGGVELLVASPLLAPPRIGLGQNGIVVLPDGSGVITTTYLPPRLNLITFGDEPRVSRIDVRGDFHDYSHLGSGADGLAWDGDALVVAFSTELVRVSSDDAWKTATASSSPIPRGGVTDVVPAGNDLYLVNGHAVEFVTGSEPDLPFTITRWNDLDR